MARFSTVPHSKVSAMTIDRTTTGIEGRIDLGKLRICFTCNPFCPSPLVPLLKIWRI